MRIPFFHHNCQSEKPTIQALLSEHKWVYPVRMNSPFSPWMSTPACILEQEVLAHLEHGDPNICVAVPFNNGKVATLPLLWALLEQICGGAVGLPLAVALLTDEHMRDYLHNTHDIAQRMHPLLPLMQARKSLRGHIRLSRTDVWRVAFDYIHQTIGDDIYHLRLGVGEDSAVFTELRNHPTGVEIANTLGRRYNQRDVWDCWNMVKIRANHVARGGGGKWRLAKELRAAEGVLRNFLHHASVDELNQALHFVLGAVLCTADTVGATNILDILHTYVGLDTQVVDTEGNISECVKTLRQLIECTPLPTLHAYMQRNTLITAVARDSEQCLRVVRKM